MTALNEEPSPEPFDDADETLSSVDTTDVNVEQLMAREIERLSLHDRNAIYEEIHGASNMAINETPDLLYESLRRFQTQLDELYGHSSRFSYDCIVNGGNSDIVEHPDFRLRFLRCVFFDPKEAVLRMLRFFEVLQHIYGEEALGRFDGSMDFFLGSGEDQAAFRMGYLQILPFRDRSGRKILILVLDALEMSGISRLKIFLYLSYVAGDDVETQRNGIVMLFWPGYREIEPPNSSHRNLVAKSLFALPTRFASFHFCFPSNPFFRIVQHLLTTTLMRGKSTTRIKIHTGERVELQYQLMGYGIPVNLIPTTGTGILKTKLFFQWVKTRKHLEYYSKAERSSTKTEKSPRIEYPGVRDVIFRSAGKSCMLNPGNVIFRGIFEQYHEDHLKANQTEKKNLVWKIVEDIESRGGRFLNWDKHGWWVPLEDRAEIRNKVAVSLRGYNKQRKADTNRQSFKSSTHAFEDQDGRGKRIKRACCYSGDSDDSQQNRTSCL